MTKAEMIKWIKDNKLESMTMQVMPPDDCQWIQKGGFFVLQNFKTGEEVSKEDLQ